MYSSFCHHADPIVPIKAQIEQSRTSRILESMLRRLAAINKIYCEFYASWQKQAGPRLSIILCSRVNHPNPEIDLLRCRRSVRQLAQ
jgi:hypothetical protein